MSKRRLQEIKSRKRLAKNKTQKTDAYLYRHFVFFAILSIINWLFWNDQFLNLEIRYYCVFVFLPLVIGFVFYYFKAKPWVESIWNTKSSGFFDTFFSNVLMLLTGLMLSFFSFGLAGSIFFKVLTELAVSDEQTIIKRFAITDFNKNDRGKGIRIFAHVYFEYPDNETESLDIRKSSVLYKELKVLSEDEIRKKKLVLYTKKKLLGC